MGRGGAVLGVVALILGASGLGLGGFAWLSVSQMETQVNSWYKFIDTPFICNPADSYLTFSTLTIEIELGSSEPVYFSFTSRAHTEAVSLDWSRIFVFFKVDGIRQVEPIAEVGMYNGDFMINHMIHLQTVRTDLSAGTHNITVVIYGDSTANYIFESTLFVQKVLT